MGFEKTLGLTAGLIFASAMAASSLTIVAADCDDGGLAPAGGSMMCYNNDNRDDAENALDANGVFYALGVGGAIIFESNPAIANGPGSVIEISFGTNANGHFEEAEVYVGNDQSTIFGGTPIAVVGNGAGPATANLDFNVAGGPYTYIGLKDITAGLSGTISSNGFDLDHIEVTTVPVPASALLLGAALVGLGAARRKS